jgi:hypothetical protein
MPKRHTESFDEQIRDALDRVPAPDLWREASKPERPQRPLPTSLSPARRAAIAAFALLVFVGAIAFALNIRGNGGAPTVVASPSDDRVSVSRLLD